MNKFDQGLRFVHNPTKSTKRRPLSKSVSVCYSLVPVCYSYVTRMYPYVPVCYVCYDIFYPNNPRIPTNYLKEMLRLILQENSFQFIGKDIFMAKIETEIINHCTKKALVWK